MNDFNKMLGSKLKEIRVENNISQEEFCNRIDYLINRSNLSKVERGEVSTSGEIIKKVINNFNVSPYWLLNIEDNNKNSSDLLDKYNRLSNTDKMTLDNYIDFLLKQNEKNLYISKNTEKEEKKSS